MENSFKELISHIESLEKIKLFSNRLHDRKIPIMIANQIIESSLEKSDLKAYEQEELELLSKICCRRSKAICKIKQPEKQKFINILEETINYIKLIDMEDDLFKKELDNYKTMVSELHSFREKLSYKMYESNKEFIGE